MLIHIKEARYLHDYVIWLRFSDGTIGEVDLKDSLWGPVFSPLKDINEFKKFLVDPEMETITWSNGADLAPEYLYERVVVIA
jgi:hypothetical protein